MELPSSGHFSRDLQDPGVSVRSLSAIEAAQSHLELCIAAFESILGEYAPADMAQFGVVRFRLCRANLARTQVAREICSHLLSSMPVSETTALRNLHQCEIEHFQLISQHVQQWTSDELQRNWPVYCMATRKLLDRTRELIATEKQLLFPLLAGIGAQRSVGP